MYVDGMYGMVPVHSLWSMVRVKALAHEPSVLWLCRGPVCEPIALHIHVYNVHIHVHVLVLGVVLTN